MTNVDRIELNVKTRSAGKHHSRALRSDKVIPAVVYGPKIETQNFSILEKDVVKYNTNKFANAIFVLKSDDKSLDNLQVLRKAIDIHPVNRRPLHLDFYALDMKQTVKVNVKINFDGKAEGEKEGGIFSAVRHELELECLPNAIPEELTIDISGMQINDVLHVSNVKVPDNVIMITPEDLTIATVSEQKAEEESTVEAAPAEGAEGEAAPAGDASAPAAEGDKKD